MTVLRIAGVLSAGVIGGMAGWVAGIFLCPDPGDIGIAAMPWAVGGAIGGAAVGVALAVAVL